MKRKKKGGMENGAIPIIYVYVYGAVEWGGEAGGEIGGSRREVRVGRGNEKYFESRRSHQGHG